MRVRRRPGHGREGIDTASEQPNIFKAGKALDVLIAMGCGNTCSHFHGKRYEDWVPDGRPDKTSTTSDASATRSANMYGTSIAALT